MILKSPEPSFWDGSDPIGWGIAVALAIPAIWLAAAAWRASKSANTEAMKSNALAAESLELVKKQDAANSRLERLKFSERLMEMERETNGAGFEPSAGRYATINDHHRELFHDGKLLDQPGTMEMVEYVSMVHVPSNRQRKSIEENNPRSRPAGFGGRWVETRELIRRWVRDPSPEIVELVRSQGRALLEYSATVAKLKGWADPK